ncbi:MAG TPA: hypothetical protein VJ770_09880 [Stellaceae bacterium]|nr:hypothetical protein [Stellaceae bacterium]
MMSKLVPPKFNPLDGPSHPPSAPTEKPELRSSARRLRPEIELLIAPGFVTEAPLPERTDPDDIPESITIEVPRRLKRALHSEVAARRGDPQRRGVASMKSVILEALAAHGFGELIRQSDIEVQAGIFMKRQSAQMKRR